MSQDLVKALGVKVVMGRIVVNEGTPHKTSLNSEVVFAESLRAALERLPVVYCRKGEIIHTAWKEHWSEELNGKPTHKARIFAIEDIPKETVKIKIHIFHDGDGNYATASENEDLLSKAMGWHHLKTVEVGVDEK